MWTKRGSIQIQRHLWETHCDDRQWEDLVKSEIRARELLSCGDTHEQQGIIMKTNHRESQESHSCVGKMTK